MPPRYFRGFDADDGYPIERVDLLEQLKVFADLHARSRFLMADKVTPVIQLNPLPEQNPAFYSDLIQAAGGVGTFTAIELANGQFSKVVCRPLFAIVLTIAGPKISIGIRAHEFLGGAPASPPNVGQTDGRRGAGGVTTSTGTLRGSAVVANLLADPVFRYPVPNLAAGQQGVVIPSDVLKNFVLAPNEDLVFQDSTANEAMEIGLLWTEEPATQATRGVAP